MLAEKTPYWYKLIFHWCTELGRYGLTIPYLVGAGVEIQQQKNVSLRSLMQEIAGSGNKTVLTYCDDLEEFIIGLHKSEYGFIGNVRSFGSLYVLSEKLDSYTTFEDLIKFLEQNYAEKIISKFYSKDYYTGNWSDFTKEESKEIEDVCLKY